MSKHLAIITSVCVASACYAPVASAADDAALNKDLLGVIGAQRFPCGEIVHVNKQAERDYLVTCKDGSSYQVIPNSEGALMAHALGQKKAR